MQTYYYVLASQSFLIEEEKTEGAHPSLNGKKMILVGQATCLEAPEMAEVKMPPAICCCYFPQFITWLKLRLGYVVQGNWLLPISPTLSYHAVVGQDVLINAPGNHHFQSHYLRP